MKKRVLMIAFHYPPCGGSSGLQRTLAFTRYLSRKGWNPALVTVSRSAYDVASSGQLDAVPPDMPICRAFAPDALRHFSLFGRYPAALAVPDRWKFWRYTGLCAALKLVKEFDPDVVWSTFPLATAHVIAAQVARRTGLPWVADMRDPMVEYDPESDQWFPFDRATRDARAMIEHDVITLASRVTFCTDGAREICLERYGKDLAAKFVVIPNGYDESSFQSAEGEADLMRPPADIGFHLVHSGTVYPGDDRGPRELFRAIRHLKSIGRLPSGFRLTMRATGHDDYVESLISELDVAEQVELGEAVPYYASLAEMMRADVLVVLQGRASNSAIPAKVYEYLRSRRPILALTHPEGDTAKLLDAFSFVVTAPLDNPDAIVNALLELEHLRRRSAVQYLPDDVLRQFSREQQSAQLAEVLDAARSEFGTARGS